jgi:TolB protein
MLCHRVFVLAAILAALGVVALRPWAPAVLVAQTPPTTGGQGKDVYADITQGGTRKLNIAIPDFAVVQGTDSGGTARMLATVAGADLNFTGQFSAVSGTSAIPAGDSAGLEQAWRDFAAAGMHAGLHGLLGMRPDRVEVEMRLYDLTASPARLIVTKKFELATDQPRRLAHKVADEVVLQFTGEPGTADTKIAYVAGRPGHKEIQFVDYDGFAPRPVTRNGSINLAPVWSPDARSLAFTSYKNGYPDLFRAFPFERRPDQTLAAFSGINSSAAWSPDAKSIAMTLSKDGNPDIYVLTLTTGNFRRLTRHAGIDTEPTWSPTGREIAFVSDRAGGAPHIFVMDAEGANVRQLTSGGRHTEPRWSPRGDSIAFTMRQGSHDIWAVNADGSNIRRLTAGPGDNQSPAWAPDGRHLVFQSSRLGSWQLFAMLPDGSEQTTIAHGSEERTSPSWSPRLP